MKKLLAMLTVLVVLLSLAGCGASKSNLIGHWEREEYHAGERYPYSFELFSDGTGWLKDYGEHREMVNCTWTEENGRIRISGRERTYAYSYKMSGGNLCLSYVPYYDETYVYIKK